MKQTENKMFLQENLPICNLETYQLLILGDLQPRNISVVNIRRYICDSQQYPTGTILRNIKKVVLEI